MNYPGSTEAVPGHWFFEKISKIVKPLARLNKKKKRIKSTKLEMKKERLQQTMQKYKGL